VTAPACPAEEDGEDYSQLSLEALQKRLRGLKVLLQAPHLATNPDARKRIETTVQRLIAEIEKFHEAERKKHQEQEAGRGGESDGDGSVVWSDDDKAVVEGGKSGGREVVAKESGAKRWLSLARSNQQEANVSKVGRVETTRPSFFDDDAEAPPRPRTGGIIRHLRRHTRGAQLVEAASRRGSSGGAARQASGSMVTTSLVRRSTALSSAAAIAQKQTEASAERISEERRIARLSLTPGTATRTPITRCDAQWCAGV
jgi:hypothetical protein